MAALKASPGQGYGGQLAAASALVNSRFAEQFTLVPFSLDARPPPQPPLLTRAAIGVSRVARFCALLPKADVVLVFAASGLSLVEKGLMCLVARAAGKGVVVRLSAGDLPTQCDASPLFKRWLERVLASAHV
ncbi:MAG TPA: hypothetical protein VHB97_11885, partial [Polyangia bacterium]|nr:hypothetical protein [Polyangia bacterium]